MMHRLTMAIAVLSVAAATTAKGTDVTVTLVSGPEGKAVPIEEKQALWKSPFGGWGVTAWPFAMRVDDTPIMEYRSAEMKLHARAMDGSLESVSAGVDRQLDETFGSEDAVRTEDIVTFRLDRRASATVDVTAGRHTIQPFGIEFEVAANGTLTSSDKRVRIDAQTRRADVVCYPITVKMLVGERSVSRSLQWSCAGVSLLSGLTDMLAEYDKQNSQAVGTSAKAGLRCVTLYLPASAPGAGYEANGVKFEVDAEGRVKLAAGVKARSKDGREVYLQQPAPPSAAAAAAPMLGVSWFNASGKVRVSCGSKSVTCDAVAKGAALPVPAAGSYQVNLGGLTVSMGAADGQLPHRHLVWDVAGGLCWAIETAPPAAKPGAVWSCRVNPLAGKAPALPAAIVVTLEAVGGGAAGGEMELKSAAGMFTGTLPAKPGFWRLRVAATDSSPLKGQTLGLAMIGDRATAAVSLFTVNNRALHRRGDKFDLLWVARLGPKTAAAEWPVRLRGAGLDAVVARISVPAGGDIPTTASGRLAVDTAALASGEYTAAVEADGVAGYPFRFRICQRERLSDFDVYSFSVHTTPATLFPGSPINSYVGSFPGGPGLEPFMADGDGALDGTLGAYANAPFGPVPEMFARPGEEERRWMALASTGAHTAPTWPEAHSYEVCNPKHTLPENLAWVRRRMALYAQTHVDYPGVGGFDYGWNWQTSGKGWWSDSGPRLDAWQPEAARQSEAAAWKLTQKMWPKVVAKYAHLKPVGKTLSDKWPKELADIPGLTEAQMRYVNAVEPSGWSLRLPNTFAEWYADLNEIMPGMTHHSHVGSPGLGGGIQYWEWHGKSHRSAVDFSEYFMSPFDGWRAPAIMAMDNRQKQKTQVAIQSHAMRSQDIPGLFAAAGRGVDGFAFTSFSDRSDPDLIGAARVFERFGTWFTTFDPLPDVALFWSRNGNAVRTALYDLARLRRPAVMVGPRDVEAGELLKYKVLLLLGVGDELPPEVLDAFRAFEAKGGVILKDDACHKNVPGRSIGLAYDGQNVSGGWGGAQAGGEGEFTWVLSLFLKKQKTLVEAFAKTPQPPVTTPDTDVLVSPLAGKDSIICFVINKTEIPLEVTFSHEKSGRFRQGMVLGKMGELQVEKGWYVHDLLAGKAAPVESTAKGQRVPVDLTAAEGAIYLLTKREPKNMLIQAERTSPVNARLTGGLADAAGKLLLDPMPFEVTLKGPDGAVLFRKFASIGPDQPFDLPVPAMSAGARPELVMRDLVLGTTAAQTLDPAAPASLHVSPAPDLVGSEEQILSFFSRQKGPVTILLDEWQAEYRPAAEKMAALLKKSGREARITTWDLADIRRLHLRWYPQKEDIEVLNSVTNAAAWAWRVDMSVWAAFEKNNSGNIVKTDYAKPEAGYAEWGPRLRHDADVVLFGAADTHAAVADLAPFLRRRTTDNYPAPGGFFIHHLWSPFRAGYNALYLGCHDVAGAEAAVACLATLKPPAPAPQVKPEGKPLIVRGGPPAPLENVATTLGGTTILNAEFSPSGNSLVVSTFSYGEWLFVLNPAGEIIEKRMPPNTKEFPNWYRWGHWVTPVSDTLMRIYLWDAEYLYDLKRGWVSKAAKVARMEDTKGGRVFQRDGERIVAMDMKGSLLWRYEDSLISPDLTAVRDVTPRAVSGNGRVLLASALAGKKDNPSVFGLDTATGKILWNHNGVLLHSGKVIPLDDRFIVMTDDGAAHEFLAADGREGSAMSSLTGTPDWVLQMPGRDSLLIVENNRFERRGPSARVYLRSLKGAADRDLKVPGRVVAVTLAPDNQSFVVLTFSHLLRFATDGALLWEAETPTGSTLRFSPDGKTFVVGGKDGVVRLFNCSDGSLRRAVDLNFSNGIAADKFAKQERMGDVPMEAARTLPAPPPEPSYLKSLTRKTVSFGPNLAPPERMRELLKPADPAAAAGEKPGYLGKLTEAVSLPPLKVDAGTTYLVELLDVVGIPTNTSSLLRLEISVTGKQQAKNLPCTVRLPVDSSLKRRRFAFRADKNDEVTLTMRPILPAVVTERNTTRRTFDKVETSNIPVVLGDVVVSALRFPGRNVLFDGGPGSGSKPAGTFDCILHALDDGVTATAERDVKCAAIGLQLVNGAIANNKTAWDKITGRAEGVVAYADAVAQFNKASALSCIVVYEDVTGPVFAKESENVRERTAARYSVEVHKPKGQWERIGVVHDNTQTINIFPCPPYEIDGIRYLWAGRHDDMDLNRTDGFVRTAQIEAYATEDALDMEELLDVKDDGGIMLD